MILQVIYGPPACGKTLYMMLNMTTTPARYIFVSPRVGLINERESDLISMVANAERPPVVHSIHSDKDRRAPIGQQIADALDYFRNEAHAILLITHEAMMGLDLDLTGWQVMIDEIPNSVLTGKFPAEASVVYLEGSYALDPEPGKPWSRVRVRDDAPDMRAVLRDGIVKDLVALDKRARSPQGVLVNVRDWDDLRQRGRKLQWWSAWTPLQLVSAESVTIAGAGYEHSLMATATEKLHSGVVKVQRMLIAGRPRQPRRIVIRYFTRAHRGSTSYWADAGRDALARVCRHLEGVLDLGYWSGNKVFTNYAFGRLAGEMISPKAEGTNSLMRHQSCAYIYSGKALPSDEPLIDLLGLTRDEIERAREFEDIIQFVARGDLRNPDATGTYDIYLYDLHQAQVVAEYLTENGFGEVELVPVVEAGLLDVVRPKIGRPPAEPDHSMTREERHEIAKAKDAARKKEQRVRDREKKMQAGTYRGRGRPRKAA
jgi:hypothetical protein